VPCIRAATVRERYTCQHDSSGPTTRSPLAYFITFSCYGARVHGEESGSVDRLHNRPGTPVLDFDPHRFAMDNDQMDQPPYTLDNVRRAVVLTTIREVCEHRKWNLRAIHVRTNHVHVVVHADAKPEKVMNDFKAYCGRRINEANIDPENRKRWTRHGSTRYLWNEETVREKIHYTLHQQGETMAVYPLETDPHH
jgi:REP element-mobilizing transposase RayT